MEQFIYEYEDKMSEVTNLRAYRSLLLGLGCKKLDQNVEGDAQLVKEKDAAFYFVFFWILLWYLHWNPCTIGYDKPHSCFCKIIGETNEWVGNSKSHKKPLYYCFSVCNTNPVQLGEVRVKLSLSWTRENSNGNNLFF